MSLIAMLESARQVADAAREEVAAQNAADIAEFEEYGTDMAAALDAQEIADAEEALRLGQELDELEDETVSERERADLDLARSLLEADESTKEECSKDEEIARAMEAQEKKEAVRVAKLERRERLLADRKLTKGDIKLAEQLAADIDREECELRELERKDRRLAQELVKHDSKTLAELPQTEEKLKHLSRTINGGGQVPMRTKLTAKLAGLRRGVSDITNKMNNVTVA